jgi:hypothetical protein
MCPPALPVTVRTGRLGARLNGDCVRDRNRFVIRVSSELDQNGAIDTLVHEWAHALAWSLECDRRMRDFSISAEEFQALSHGPAWGVAYSRAWQTFMRIVQEPTGGHS